MNMHTIRQKALNEPETTIWTPVVAPSRGPVAPQTEGTMAQHLLRQAYRVGKMIANTLTFLDSTALPDCPTGWTAVQAGPDGMLYATATNGGGGAGALYRVVYDDTAENKVGIYDKGIDPLADFGEQMDFDLPAPVFAHRKGDLVYPLIPWREPLAAELEHFFECVETGAEPLTGTAHAARVVDILERAQEPAVCHG